MVLAFGKWVCQVPVNRRLGMVRWNPHAMPVWEMMLSRVSPTLVRMIRLWILRKRHHMRDLTRLLRSFCVTLNHDIMSSKRYMVLFKVYLLAIKCQDRLKFYSWFSHLKRCNDWALLLLSSCFWASFLIFRSLKITSYQLTFHHWQSIPRICQPIYIIVTMWFSPV